MRRINHESDFTWQAQYLMKLECDFSRSRIVNDVSYVMRINDEIHFARQAQNLVKLECHFSWQVQHFLQFWEIAGPRHVVFFLQKCV